MQLSVKQASIPPAVFLLMCALFVLIQRYGVDLIRLYYDVCHFLYGLTFPLIFGFIVIQIPAKADRVPLRVLIAKLRTGGVRDWPKEIARGIRQDLQQGIPWNPWQGALWIAAFSIYNEVLIDPTTNGNPFATSYSNLTADLAGVATFLLLVRILDRSKSDTALQLKAVALKCARRIKPYLPLVQFLAASLTILSFVINHWWLL